MSAPSQPSLTDVTLARWARDAQRLTLSFTTPLREVWEARSVGEPETDEVLAQIQYACHSASESVLWLAQARKLWDADVLMRSVVEGTAKFGYLCTPDEVTRRRLFTEYRDVLPEMAELSDHERAVQSLAIIRDETAEMWRPIRDMLRTPERIAELNAKYPRSARRSLEGEWGFRRIAEKMESAEYEGLKGLLGLVHQYSISSRVLHVDWLGSGVVWERRQRSVERIDAIELAHGGRIMSDVVTCAFMRAYVAYKYKRLSVQRLLNDLPATRPLFAEMELAQQTWRGIEYPTA